REKGEKITMIVAEDDREEAQAVVSAIRDGIYSKRQNPSDFAIMYRTNAQSRLFEEAFRREGINYRLVGAQRFYGRREVKDMLAFLRLVHNPLDEISLRRCINLPPRGIGAKTLESLQNQAATSGLTMGEVLLDLAQGRADLLESMGREGAKLATFGTMLLKWRETAQHNSLVLLFDRIVVDTGYEPYIRDKSEEGQDRWENLLELRAVVLEYEDKGLADFLESMALVSDQDTLPETVDAPTMLTLHAAKGLEFENVFITGLDENILPHRRAVDDEEELAEERRLLYVGITRAKSKLTLSRARRRRSPYGSYEETLASRFLDDIPEEHLTRSPRGLPSRYNYDSRGYGRGGYDDSLFGEGSFGRGSSYGQSSSRGRRSGTSRWENPAWMQQKNVPKEPPKTKYKAGQQVKHATYGRGVVKSSKIEFGDETVEVYFEGHGLKALVASMAKLEVLR
ncbi:MAG: ATP-binding domain-containing protein, partial [Chloroflexi bacterium]|nr:ATP-binding domain-containing protein [Chloroflexota bacterium]